MIDLVQQKCEVSWQTAYGIVVEAMTGKKVEYRDPDYKADAIYSYRDIMGRLLKQVLRYPPDEEHPDKWFRQRQPKRGGGWRWDIEGVPSTLYNLDVLRDAHMVCITEGEKDADTIARQKLYDDRGQEVIATTSGPATSWEDLFADDLRGKRVVLMPDADEAGKRYEEEVVASLNARNIEFRILSFADVGTKDVSEFIKHGGTGEDLVRRIGSDWVQTTEGSPIIAPSGSVADI